MAGAASQAGDADSSRAPGLASGLRGSVGVHRGALLLVPQWQCISSFVFYIQQNIAPADVVFGYFCSISTCIDIPMHKKTDVLVCPTTDVTFLVVEFRVLTKILK